MPKTPFQISSTAVPSAGIRHVLTHRGTRSPMPAGSLYEAHLAQKTDSHNTRSRELSYLASMYAWAEQNRIDLDRLLLRGEGLTPPHIRSFAAWIRASHTQPNGVIPQESRPSINASFGACSVISTWFIKQFASPSNNRVRRMIDVEHLINAQKRAWKEVRIKVRKDPAAPDMTEEEIAAIEQFLKPQNRARIVGEAIAARDYLMWRMAIEFGMRKGEILAMRTIDCPTRAAPYFRIVRIEERGPEYVDPRKDPPRPKTLSRDLGFIIERTVFPKLVTDYISVHRYKWVKHNGKKRKQFLLPHNLLIIARNGEPLSLRSADDVARMITAGTGVDFNWHLARHAFFNRAYAGVVDIRERDHYIAKVTDLVYWGGWVSEKSLEIYTKRARAERARHALCTWQKEGNQWTALA